MLHSIAFHDVVLHVTAARPVDVRAAPSVPHTGSSQGGLLRVAASASGKTAMPGRPGECPPTGILMNTRDSPG